MTLEISQAARHALSTWLDHQSALKEASDHTISAYRTDVVDFIAFLTAHHAEPLGLAPLARVTTSDMRGWLAHLRAQGIASRSVARKRADVDAGGFEPRVEASRNDRSRLERDAFAQNTAPQTRVRHRSRAQK